MEILRTICLVFLLGVLLPAGSGLSQEQGSDTKPGVLTVQEGAFGVACNQYDAPTATVVLTGPTALRTQTGWRTAQIDGRLAQRIDAGSRRETDAQRPSSEKERKSEAERVWRSPELSTLAIGMGVGDVDGDGANEIVLIDPSTVYVYRFASEKMDLLAEYSARPLELKSVDVAKLRKQGPARIYVTAQNRGSISSFVLEYRDRKLTPVVQDFPYYLRLIHYPTQGPILLGQKKGLGRIYDGPVYRLTDKGDDLEVQGRFGVPLKIPVFGFTVGDFAGKHTPLIAVYDKDDHLRIYEPSGKRVFLSKDYYGGSDVLLRKAGPEVSTGNDRYDLEQDTAYFRPRIMTLDRGPTHEILVIAHSSKTMRLLGRTKMFEEGQVLALAWNGDALEEKWTTPKVQGMITDFAIDTLPGLVGQRLITLERKKTDWLAFLKSQCQVRVYDLNSLITEGQGGRSGTER
ncbi:MAG: hypothetical protein ACLP5H_22505 [Desulfomonilaceae bacterium]